jgi:hypothetical protein
MFNVLLILVTTTKLVSTRTTILQYRDKHETHFIFSLDNHKMSYDELQKEQDRQANYQQKKDMQETEGQVNSVLEIIGLVDGYHGVV